MTHLMLLLLPAALAATAAAADVRGLLDVTRAPFSVDSSGATDVTAGLQSAIQYAHDNYLAVFDLCRIARSICLVNSACLHKSQRCENVLRTNQLLHYTKFFHG